MSSYTRMTKHPKTKKWEEAQWINDLLGHHHYGVVFPSDRKKQPLRLLQEIAYSPRSTDLKTR